MTYELGVDLGTTFTAAAVHRDGEVVVAELGGRAATIPSVVHLREDGTFLVGDAAVRRAVTEPSRVAREFKRRVGDPTPIIVGGRPFPAETLSAELLRAVVDQITEREGGPPRRLAVTHPANWGAYKLSLLRDAIVAAGFDEALTLAEPEAAAIHYATLERVETGRTVAVFDLGGGTFDASILRKLDEGYEVLGRPEGIERLGGIDFDEAVFAQVNSSLAGALQQLDPEDPAAVAAVARLRADCADAKEALSVDTQVVIPVVLPNVQTEIRITRAELEQLIRPSLGDAVGAMRRAIRGAGLDVADIDIVLLVGGSSRIPLVAQLVAGELGRPVAIDVHPKHSVAMGAAWAAAGPGVAERETTAPRTAPIVPPPIVAPSPAVPPTTEPPPSAEPVAAPAASEPPPSAEPVAAPVASEPPPSAEPVAAPVASEPAPPPPAPAPTPAPDASRTTILPSRPPAPEPQPLAGTAEGRSRTGLIIGGVLAAAVVIIAAVVVFSGGSDDDEPTEVTTADTAPPATTGPPTTAPPETSEAAPPPTEAPERSPLLAGAVGGSGFTAATIPLGPNPVNVEVGFGSVWVAMHDSSEVWRVNPESMVVEARIFTGPSPLAMLPTSRGLWVGNANGNTVSLIDVDANEVVVELEVGPSPFGMTAVDGSVYLAVRAGQEIVEIDEATATVVSRSPNLGAEPATVQRVGDLLWSAGVKEFDVMWRLPVGDLGTVDTFPDVGGAGRATDRPGPVHFEANDDCACAYISYGDPDVLIRVDPVTGDELARVEVGLRPVFRIGPDAVWVTPVGSPQVQALDPETLQLIGLVETGQVLEERLFAVDEEALWVLGAVDDGPVGLTRLTPTP